MYTVKIENCAWILFVLYVWAVVYRTIKISHTCIFVHKNTHKYKNTQKKYPHNIVGVTSIKTHNKTTTQFYSTSEYQVLYA